MLHNSNTLNKVMLEHYETFEWKEIEPNVWERDIDEAERFYSHLARAYEGSGRMFFAITGHAIIKPQVGPDEAVLEALSRLRVALRCAWLQLRFECPTIASRVVWSERIGRLRKQYRCIMTEEEKNEWLDRTIRFINTGQTGVEWANSDAPAPSVATLFVVKPPQAETAEHVRLDLVLRSPHDIIDGIGTLQLIGKLTSLLEKAYTSRIEAVPTDGEVKLLSPPLRVAAAIDPSLKPDQKKSLESFAQGPLAPSPDVHMAKLPYRIGTKLPGKHQRRALVLSEKETEAILRGCKTIGATVTHVFHAAAAMALRDRQQLQETTSRVRYVCYLLSNERPMCKSPYNTAAHAAAVYHSCPPKRLAVDLDPRKAEGNDLQSQLLDTVKQFRDFYISVREDVSRLALAPHAWAANCPAWSQSGHPPPIPEPNATPSVSISSMGVIDKLITPGTGAISVEEPWVTGEELGTGFGLFLGTFRGCLELSGAYNDAWHDADEMEAFLGDCCDIVRKGLVR